jgi:hypothetical protein
MKKSWYVILLCFALFAQVTTLYAADDIKFQVNRNYVEFEKPPTLVNGRVLVQIRPIVEAIGCHVVWDNTYKTQYINTYDIPIKKVYTRADHIRVFVNNHEIQFDQPPLNLDGYIFIPARHVCEALDFEVIWDGINRVVRIIESAGRYAHIDAPDYYEPTNIPVPTFTPTNTPVPTPIPIYTPTKTPAPIHASPYPPHFFPEPHIPPMPPPPPPHHFHS